MIHKLPVEVIISVSSLLDLVDKFNLMATCKKLNDIISNTNLYECLDLVRYQDYAMQFLEKCYEEPAKGAQVKKLHIDINSLSDTSICQLSSVLPNIARLKIEYHSMFDTLNWQVGTFSEPLNTWRNTLEVYHTRKDWYAIWYALQEYPFPRLTELEITEENFIHSTPGQVTLQPINNSPSLKQLTIRECWLDLNFLEELHRSSPFVTSLTLVSILLTVDALPKTIVPASSVVHLEIHEALTFDKNGLLMEYILKKYPCLKHLYFVIDENSKSFVNGLGRYFPGSSKYFPDNDDHDDSDEDDNRIEIQRYEYEKLYSGFKSSIKIYRSSAQEFILSLPKTIKSLRVNADAFSNIMELLADSDTEVTELDIRNRGPTNSILLDDPNQLSYFQHLPTLKTLSISLNMEPISFHQHPTAATNTITKLTIDGNDTSIYMDWLLSVFPSVEELCVTGHNTPFVQVGDQTQAHVQQKYPNLRKLKLKHVLIKPNVLDYIKLAAPNLKALELEIEFMTLVLIQDEIYSVDVTVWDLEVCLLSFYYYGVKIGGDRYCKITIDHTSRRFIFPAGNDTVRFPPRSFSFKGLRQAAIVDIKCGDVKHLRVCGVRLKKVGYDIVAIE